jgi:orotidine-5'-phosphate decarboxylase
MSGENGRQGFLEAVGAARATMGSCLCIGLDPEPDQLPASLTGADGLVVFCRQIVEATSDLVCAYKPNVAFFERFGSSGWKALEDVVKAVPAHIPVIADAKRGDIGNTSKAYADAVFDRLGASACTVSPYLGLDAVAPFIDHTCGFVFVLCRTSNPGAAVLQDAVIDGEPLYARVMRLFQPAIEAGKAGLVIGAREREAFAWAARLAPGSDLLVPGIGAQGGTAIELGQSLAQVQREHLVVSVSRAIIHAGQDEGFAQAARARAIEYRDALRAALSQPQGSADASTAG